MLCKKYGRANRIRQQTLQLVSALNRWCQVREDLLYAFRKYLEQDVEPPLRDVVAAFLARVEGGMPVDQALDLMQHDAGHEHFLDMVTAIRFNFRYRGDLPALLDHLEWQLNRVEEEYIRRSLTSARERRITAVVLLAVPAFCLLRLMFHQTTRHLLLNTASGRLLLAASALIYLLAVVFFLLLQQSVKQ